VEPGNGWRRNERTPQGNKKARRGREHATERVRCKRRDCFEDVGQERRHSRGNGPQGTESLLESERPHREADFYRKGTADAHRRFDPQPAKAGGGEQRAYITPFRMPRSSRVCRLGNKLTDGSLGR